MLRKILLLSMVILSIILLGVGNQSTQAEEPPQGTVVVGTLNVRSEPAIDDNIIGQFTNGTRLNVLGREELWNRSHWLYVTDNVLTGWVNFSYVQMDEATAYQELSVLIDRSTIPETPITAHSNVDNLHLRAEPSTSSETLTNLPDNTPLTIVGHDDIRGNGGRWLEVVVNDGSGLHGWVSCRFVILDGIRNRSSWSACFDVSQAPVTAADNRTLSSPIMPQGVTMATWQVEFNSDWHTLKVRRLPTVDSDTLAEVPLGGLMAVHGTHTQIRRNLQHSYWTPYLWNENPWFYVTDIATGTLGWVRYHDWLNFSWHYDLSNLIVLDSVENPAIPAGIVPVDSLAGVIDIPEASVRTTHREVMLRHPAYRLPEGISVTLIGRDLRLEYVYIQTDDIEGWVDYTDLVIEGDAHRLPIMYINWD